MARADLPLETQDRSLSYRELIDTLSTVAGEIVVASLAPRDVPRLVSVVGQLNKEQARYDRTDMFSIGDPYPDRYPESLAGGVIYLSEDIFETATLSTYDGNDLFIINIQTRSLQITIQDEDSGYP